MLGSMQSLKTPWIAALERSTGFFLEGGEICGPETTKPLSAMQTGVSEFNLDDDLLSHGETPHYHRRCIVSLLSSGWDQVVPMLYGRQEIRVLSRDQMASLQQIGYVTAFGVCEHRTFGSFRLHTPQSGLFDANCLGVIWSSLTGN